MAGYKVWAFKELLTSADLNGFLMAQAVPRFATQAARNSAIAAPDAGQLAYTDDVKVTWQYADATAGWVPMPGTVIVDAYATASQTLTTSGTGYVILMGTASRNLLGGYVTGTGKFTAPWPGYYTIRQAVTFASNATGFRQMSIRNGGTTTATGGLRQSAAVASVCPMELSLTQYLAATNFFEPLALQTSGGALDLSPAAAPHYASRLSIIYQGL